MDADLMHNAVLILVLVSAVVLVAGCTDLANLFPGPKAISVNVVDEYKDTKDMLSFAKIWTEPQSPILTNRQVTFSVLVQNNDKYEPVKNMVVQMYDAPTFKSLDGKTCNSNIPLACKPEKDDPDKSYHTCSGIEGNRCEINPDEQKLLTYKIMTPTDDEVVHVKSDVELKFLASYQFNSKLNLILPIVNYDEMVRRQREGTSDTVQLVKSHGAGPIQIDVDLMGENYILADQPSIISVTLRDVGSGSLVEGIDPKNTDTSPDTTSIPALPKRKIKLEINFPEQIGIVEKPDGFDLAYTDTTNNANNPGTTAISTADIDFFKGKTQQSINFKIKLKDDVKTNFQTLHIPFRSYAITAQADYFYEIRNSIKVTIQPSKV
ncbi:MAG: hypothetical protein HY832_03985 [Candidatus Aenigmarchaeota archaeon]|nr:hypothetical protein [Candidatus Aenigmarchaeota archaeon]